MRALCCLCAANTGSGSGFTAATVQKACGELVVVFYIGQSGPVSYTLVSPPSSSSGSISYSEPTSVDSTGSNVLQPTGVYFRNAVWAYYIDADTGKPQYVKASTACKVQ